MYIESFDEPTMDLVWDVIHKFKARCIQPRVLTLTPEAHDRLIREVSDDEYYDKFVQEPGQLITFDGLQVVIADHTRPSRWVVSTLAEVQCHRM